MSVSEVRRLKELEQENGTDVFRIAIRPSRPIAHDGSHYHRAGFALERHEPRRRIQNL